MFPKVEGNGFWISSLLKLSVLAELRIINFGKIVIELFVWEKINYTHLNPVKSGIVDDAEYYIYSSARDYLGIKGLVNVEVMV